jgi:hypothetical protein
MSSPSTKRCASPPGSGAELVAAGSAPGGAKPAVCGAAGALKFGPTAHAEAHAAVTATRSFAQDDSM